MGRLPSGTITCLFTDVEGSTRLLAELGSGYAEALAEHRRVLRRVFGDHHGVEVDTQGDAFFYVFVRASEAVAAAAAAQEALASGPMCVRMGLHTGEPTLSGGSYTGLDVHRAARIAAAGHGGQVLMSQATRDLAGVEVRDLGPHHLKDLPEPERIFQLGTHEFSPVRSLYQTHVPTPATAFVGRRDDVDAVRNLLADPETRLLTLTGPGGTGKTRLALQAAAESAGRYADGVYWVGLAALRDARLVVPTIAAELGTEQLVIDHINDKELLLLLDNFEQVLDAAVDIAALVADCPNLDVLITSRAPLRISGEHTVAVAPMAEADAISVFTQRATANRPDFDADPGTVAEICRRVDYLPLAVELAAARVNVLSAAAILEQLDRVLPALTGGPRDAPERQRTLRATIDWSYELLSSSEQGLLARLAVFRGGCTLEAAEHVCSVDLETLTALTENSLVRRRGNRYWMLETIREYGAERLDDRGDRDEVMRRLAEHLAGLGDAAYDLDNETDAQTRPEELARLIRELADELDNLRAAFAWTLRTPAPELALRLSSQASWFAGGSGNFRTEQNQWLDEALRIATSAPSNVRARALEDAAENAYTLGEHDKARRMGQELLALHRESGDEGACILVLTRLGVIAAATADERLARDHYEEAIAIAERLSHRRLYRPLHGLGELELQFGNLDRAQELLNRSAMLAQAAGDHRSVPYILNGAGDTALLRGDHQAAIASYCDALHLCRELSWWHPAVYCVAGLAAVAATQGDTRRAGRLWGARKPVEHEFGWHVLDHEAGTYATPIAACSEANPIAFQAAAEQGRRMTPDAAFRYALEAAP
jgi:predicted ATPase